MQRYSLRARVIASFAFSSVKQCPLRYASTATTVEKPGERLRILFCGSDQFSACSLRALAKYASSLESNIESVDVVTRNDKWTGRGLRRLESPPVKQVAQELELPLHQIDTFTGWSPPIYDETSKPPSVVNLIVAVSFGLLVPPRILRGATYGGLNVHPSLLPQFKGAAPIQWTILHGLKNTGVSLQTLHDSKFDEGLVLDSVAVSIEDPHTCTYVQLREQLGHVGAELLVKGIQEKRYLSHKPTPSTNEQEASYAPKLSNRHMSINPGLHNAGQIVRMRRAFGKLWAYAEDWDGQQVRLILGRVYAQETHELLSEAIDIVASIPTGVPYSVIENGQDMRQTDQPLRLNTTDGLLIIDTMTVAGSRLGNATASAAKWGLLKHYATFRDTSGKKSDVYKFCGPLRGEYDGLPTVSGARD
jgi:methionyl-tRNA formyltransferase